MLRPPLSPTLSTNAASFSVLLILIQVAACGGWVVVRDAVAEQETNTKGGPLGDPGHQEIVDFAPQYAVRIGFS